MKNIIDDKKIARMIENYENGNKADFREDLQTLNPAEVAKLIARWQPYHSAIVTIVLNWEIIENNK